jgi:hypothetical protein
MAINDVTKDMLSMLPSWMDIRNEDSVGAQFLNVPGKRLEELETYLKRQFAGLFIDEYVEQDGNTIVFDKVEDTVDIIYKVPIIPEVLDLSSITVIGCVDTNGRVTEYRMTECNSVYDFYDNSTTPHKFIIDTDKRLCYLRTNYDYIKINGSMFYDIAIHHVWNCYDEIGLLVGLTRIYGEKNRSFKQRIVDVFKNPGGADKQGLKNALARELGVPSADIEVNSLGDPAFKGTLLNIDGTPTDKLMGYAKKVNETMAMTWGEASWDRGYWASINQDNIGLDYLPHMWDAPTTGWSSTDFQSGIGTHDDLYVEAPKRTSDVQDFDYYVGLAGIKYDQTEVYPPHSFKFKLTAKGTVVSESIVPEEYYYTVIAAPRIPLIFKVRAEKDYEQNPSSTFNGTVYNNSDYSGLTATQKEQSYIVSDTNKIEIVDSTRVPNPPQRYIEIKVDMWSDTGHTSTPKVDDITLTWTDTSDVAKSVKIDTQNTISQNGNNYTIGFTSNTWADVDPIIRVENDDSNMSFGADGSANLGFGDYYKMIDTEGDWNRSQTKTNVVITGDGDLKLSI